MTLVISIFRIRMILIIQRGLSIGGRTGGSIFMTRSLGPQTCISILSEAAPKDRQGLVLSALSATRVRLDLATRSESISMERKKGCIQIQNGKKLPNRRIPCGGLGIPIMCRLDKAG